MTSKSKKGLTKAAKARTVGTLPFIAGSEQYHEAIRKASLALGREFTRQELDAFRIACKGNRPRGGRGAQERNSKAFRGQGKTITGKRVYVSQLPLDWQCR